MKTSLCHLLGMEFPIIQAGTASAAGPELVSAVANAGAFGFLGCSGMPPEVMRARIQQTRTLTDRPFGVNLIVPKLLPGQIEVCQEEKIRCVAFFWGEIAAYVPPLHEAGVLVTAQVGSVEEARKAVSVGADFVIAQGFEAGGHVRGTVSTFALLPRVVEAISPVPVVAAGGIADGRGLAAALALGAQAVSMGTRFIATVEAACHPAYKRRIVEAAESDTVYTTLFDRGWEDAPHRVLRNRQVNEWESSGHLPPGHRIGEGDIVGQCTINDKVVPVCRYSSWMPRADFTGDLEETALYAGESCGLIKEIRPAAEVVREIVKEANG